MYARQTGWYNATPEKKDMSRAEEISFYLEEPELDLPEVQAEYLVPLFYESGIYKAGANGAIPLEWGDIESWLNVTENKLQMWEKLAIKEMSNAYVAELYKGKDIKQPAPYSSEKSVYLQRQIVAATLRVARENRQREKVSNGLIENGGSDEWDKVS